MVNTPVGHQTGVAHYVGATVPKHDGEALPIVAVQMPRYSAVARLDGNQALRRLTTTGAERALETLSHGS